MIHGPVAERVIRGQTARRRELPAAFVDLEYLDDSLEVFTKAYHELDKERPRASDQIFPISRRMVWEWCRWYGYENDFDFRELLFTHVEAMDRVYIEIEGNRIRAEHARKARQEALAAKRANKGK